MTRRLRGIHAAWHFWCAVSFGGESGVRKVPLCGIHPLTQRYALIALELKIYTLILIRVYINGRVKNGFFDD
ncbi:TPA: DUF3265 domain-containing protein [Vibrio vulnificus]|nr:DUF3265 domain-containing protein [Vibrio vulnificus]